MGAKNKDRQDFTDSFDKKTFIEGKDSRLIGTLFE
jgi:hypothetical protein